MMYKSTTIKNRINAKTLVSVMMAGLVAGSVIPVTAQEPEPIPKFLLIKLTRDQFSSMCGTPEFTQCMGFDEQQCLEISNKAIDTCLGPLPAAIDPTALENDALEACPQKVFNEAGFAEEKAKQCFAEVIR